MGLRANTDVGEGKVTEVLLTKAFNDIKLSEILFTI